MTLKALSLLRVLVRGFTTVNVLGEGIDKIAWPYDPKSSFTVKEFLSDAL